MCCKMLQSVAVCLEVHPNTKIVAIDRCVGVCSWVLQIVVGCCGVLQGVVVSCRVLQCVAVCCGILQCVAECCNMFGNGLGCRIRRD